MPAYHGQAVQRPRRHRDARATGKLHVEVDARQGRIVRAEHGTRADDRPFGPIASDDAGRRSIRQPERQVDFAPIAEMQLSTQMWPGRRRSVRLAARETVDDERGTIDAYPPRN